jgi:Fe-S cluster assembly protein SufD
VAPAVVDPDAPLWTAELERRSIGHPAWVGGAGVERRVVVDGHLEPRWGDDRGTAGVTTHAGPPAPFEPDERTDAFEALNHLRNPGTFVVDVTEGSAPAELHVVHVGTGCPGGSHPRTRLRVGPGARITLVETYWPLPGASLVNTATAVEVAPGGHVDHVRVLWAPGGTAAHVGRTTIVVGAGATVRSGTLQIGGGPGRHTVVARLPGPRSVVEINGLSLPSGGAHLDTDVSVRHLADHGTSRLHHVGIVPDRGRVSFGGHVLVAADTAGTDADQQSHDLLLGPTARADTRPWLEIYADDVACTHGATVGRLDGDGLFYLRSRGIPEHAARTLLLEAFAAAALDRLAAPGPTRDWLATITSAAIADVLDATRRPARVAR